MKKRTREKGVGGRSLEILESTRAVEINCIQIRPGEKTDRREREREREGKNSRRGQVIERSDGTAPTDRSAGQGQVQVQVQLGPAFKKTEGTADKLED